MPQQKTLWDDPGPDRGWSWIILVLDCIFIALIFGLYSTGSSGVFFTEFIFVLGIDRKHAAWPFGVVGIMQCITGASFGIINSYFGLRTIILASVTCCTIALTFCFWATDIIFIVFIFGIFYGIGCGLSIPCTILLLNQYFKKHLAISNSIFMVSLPIAGLILPYFVTFLVNTYSFRGAMLLTGGLEMQLFIIGLLMRPRTSEQFSCLNSPVNLQLTEEVKEKNGFIKDDKGTKKFINTLKEYKAVLTDPMFYTLMFQVLVTSDVLVGISLSVIDFALDNSLTRENGIHFLFAFSGCDMLGRITFGVILDRRWIHKAKLSMIATFTMGSCLMLFNIEKNIVFYFFIFGVIGFNAGGLATTGNVYLIHYIKKQYLPSAFGLRTFFSGLTSFIRPILAGVFRDNYLSYHPFYYMLGSVSLFSAIMWSMEPLFMKIKAQRTSEEEEQV